MESGILPNKYEWVANWWSYRPYSKILNENYEVVSYLLDCKDHFEIHDHHKDYPINPPRIYSQEDGTRITLKPDHRGGTVYTSQYTE